MIGVLGLVRGIFCLYLCYCAAKKKKLHRLNITFKIESNLCVTIKVNINTTTSFQPNLKKYDRKGKMFFAFYHFRKFENFKVSEFMILFCTFFFLENINVKGGLVMVLLCVVDGMRVTLYSDLARMFFDEIL